MNWIDYLVIIVLIIWLVGSIYVYKKQKNNCHGNCVRCLLASKDLKERYTEEREE